MNKKQPWNWQYRVKRNNGFDFFFSRMPRGKIKKPGLSDKTEHFKSGSIERAIEKRDMLAENNLGIEFQIFNRDGERVGPPLMCIAR